MAQAELDEQEVSRDNSANNRLEGLNQDIIDLLRFAADRKAPEGLRADGARLERSNEEGRETVRLLGQDGKERLRIELEHNPAGLGLPEMMTQRLFLAGSKDPIIVCKSGEPGGYQQASIHFPDNTEQTLRTDGQGNRGLSGTYNFNDSAGNPLVYRIEAQSSGGIPATFIINGDQVSDPRMLQQLIAAFNDSFSMAALSAGQNLDSAHNPSPSHPDTRPPDLPVDRSATVTADQKQTTDTTSAAPAKQPSDTLSAPPSKEAKDTALPADNKPPSSEKPPEKIQYFNPYLALTIGQVPDKPAPPAAKAPEKAADKPALPGPEPTSVTNIWSHLLHNPEQTQFLTPQYADAMLANIRNLDAHYGSVDTIIRAMPEATRRHFVDGLIGIINNNEASREARQSAMDWMGSMGSRLTATDLRALLDKSSLATPYELRESANRALIRVFNTTDNADIQRACLNNITMTPESPNRERLVAALDNENTRDSAVRLLMQSLNSADETATLLGGRFQREPQLAEAVARVMGRDLFHGLYEDRAREVFNSMMRQYPQETMRGILDAASRAPQDNKIMEMLLSYTHRIPADRQPELLATLTERAGQGGGNSRVAYRLLSEIAIGYPGRPYTQQTIDAARQALEQGGQNPQRRRAVLDGVIDANQSDRPRAPEQPGRLQTLLRDLTASTGQTPRQGESTIQTMERYARAGNSDAIHVLSRLAHSGRDNLSAGDALNNMVVSLNQERQTLLQDARRLLPNAPSTTDFSSLTPSQLQTLVTAQLQRLQELPQNQRQTAIDALNTWQQRLTANSEQRDRIIDTAIATYASSPDRPGLYEHMLDSLGRMLDPNVRFDRRETLWEAAIRGLGARAQTAQRELEAETDPQRRAVLEARRDASLAALALNAGRQGRDYSYIRSDGPTPPASQIPRMAAQQLTNFAVGRGMSQEPAAIEARNNALMNVIMNNYRQNGDNGHLLAALGGAAFLTPNAPAAVRQLLEQAAREQAVPSSQEAAQDRRRRSATAGLIALEGGIGSPSRDAYPDASVPLLSEASLSTLESYRRAIPVLNQLRTPEGARTITAANMGLLLEAQAMVTQDQGLSAQGRQTLSNELQRAAISALNNGQDAAAKHMAFEQLRLLGWSQQNNTAAQESVRRYALDYMARNPSDSNFVTEASRMVDLGRRTGSTEGLAQLPLESLARQIGAVPGTVSDATLTAALAAAQARLGEQGLRTALTNFASWQVLTDTERQELSRRLNITPPGAPANPSFMDVLNSLGQQTSPYQFLSQPAFATRLNEYKDSVQTEIQTLQTRLQEQANNPELARLLATTQAGSGTSKWWLLAAGVGYPLREWGILGLTRGNYGAFSDQQREQQQAETAARQQFMRDTERLASLQAQSSNLRMAGDIAAWSTQIAQGHRQEANRLMTGMIGNYGVAPLINLSPAVRNDYLSLNGYQSEVQRSGLTNAAFVPPYRFGQSGSAGEALAGLRSLQTIMGSNDFSDMNRPENRLRVGHVQDAMIALSSDPEMRRILGLSVRLPQELQRLTQLFQSGLVGTRGEHYTSFVMEQAVQLRALREDANALRERAREYTTQMQQTLNSLPANSPERRALEPILQQLRAFNQAVDGLNTQNTARMFNTIPQPRPELDSEGRQRRDEQGRPIYQRDTQGRLLYTNNSDFDPHTFGQWARTDGVRLATAIAGLTAGFLLAPEGAPIWLISIYEGIGATIGTHAGHEIVRATGSSQYGSPVVDSFLRNQTVRLDGTAPGGFRVVTPGQTAANLLTEASINVLLAGGTNYLTAGVSSEAFRNLFRGLNQRVGNYSPSAQHVMELTAQILRQTESTLNPNLTSRITNEEIRRAVERGVADAEARLYSEVTRPQPLTQEMIDRTVAQSIADHISAALRGARLGIRIR